jgi:NADPH-dependent glutamate synthase beta subunit-like oxidoreductase
VEPDQLKDEGYQAVFMAVGAHKGYRLGVSGEGLPGVISGVEFLRLAALGQAVSPGRRVAVIGGGNVAIDAARTALRMGSEEVTILYRRTQAEMPAYDEEIAEALEEGVKLKLLCMPTQILEKNGSVSGSNA